MATRPNISLSSDFIVGFPGETNSDFEDTMNLIIEIGFDTSFSFIYSARPGTPASNLRDETSDQEKKHRLATLQSQITKQANTISESMVGTEQRILVTGKSKVRAAPSVRTHLTLAGWVRAWCVVEVMEVQSPRNTTAA